MKCKNCGATLDEGALFCRRCGTAAPPAPEPKPKRAAGKKRANTGWLANVLAPIKGIGAWFADAFLRIKDRFADLKQAKIFKNRRLMMLIGAVAALLLVLIIVIASASSCCRTKQPKTPDDTAAAVIEALESGDGEALYRMTELSRAVLGAHPETFGAGDTPEAVMRGYYERLAGDLHGRLTEEYGEGFRLIGTLQTTVIDDTSIFETNRALGLEATQYAEISGPLSVDGETVTEIHIVAVELDGEWKPLVVYLY